MASVGESSGNGRRYGTERTDQGEHADLRLREREAAGELERDGGQNRLKAANSRAWYSARWRSTA